MTDFKKLSRRQVLGAAAGITVAGALVAATPAEAAKVKPTAVKYQTEPKGESKCEGCRFFEAPSSCKSVDGEISPNGWCILWSKKPA